jgi:hypothetical protein
LSVSNHVVSSYQLASLLQEKVINAWITGSLKLGGELPESLLNLSIQRAGRLDAVLRCMEDEWASDSLEDSIRIFGTDYLASLSELWVGQVYEILRLTLERKLIVNNTFFEALANDFRLLRIPMEKFEIARDRSLTGPLAFTRVPPKKGDIDYHYDKNDPLRAHHMPIGILQNGSMQWCAIDISNKPVERWIVRRDLSDRVLQLLCI